MVIVPFGLRSKVEVAEVDRNHQEIADGVHVRRAHVSTTARRKPQPADVYDLCNVLCGRKASGDVDVIIVAPQSVVVTEVEVLFGTMARDVIREPCTQPAPALVAFSPWIDLRHFEARHRHEERSREV